MYKQGTKVKEIAVKLSSDEVMTIVVYDEPTVQAKQVDTSRLSVIALALPIILCALDYLV